MGDAAESFPDHHLRHDTICDSCHETIFGIRHQCLICPDWNYCNNCITQAPRKHALHEFAVIPDPKQARDTAAVRRQALDFGRLETRFLTIGPSPPSSNLPTGEAIKVSCELGIRSLYECPEYIALSYSWGDHNSTRPILLEGCITQVTTSLEAALQELVARGVEVVWVDALCIDQENDYEKVYQLRQMGTIFSKAATVVAWLGPAADDSDDVMQALATMREARDVVAWLEPGADDSDDAMQALADLHGPAIMKLLKRQYWERVWVIQELAKASNVEVWCGTQMLPWDIFIVGVQKWWSNSKLRVGYFDHPVFTLKHFCDAERDIRRGTARMLLSTAIMRTLHTKATLERDRIYALLGIARDGAETISTPNYVQSDAKVFKSVFKHMIVEQGQLSFILLAGLGREKADSPSWLPDRMPVEASPWIAKCFMNLLDRKDVVTCHDNVLEVKAQILGQIQPDTSNLTASDGLKLDHAIWNLQVAQTSGLTTSDAPELCYAITYLYYVAQQLWICGIFEYGAVPPYPLPETCARVLSVFWSLPADDRVRCPKLRQWFEENADTLHRTSLRSSVKTVSEWQPRKNFSSYLAEPFEDPDHWPWLEKLEASVASMLRHGFRIRKLDNQKLVVVPVSAEALDFVVHFADCSMHVVLRESSDGMYSVVGEVVGVIERAGSLRHAYEMRLREGHIAWRRLHLI
jgi:hypothetical protein